MAKQLKDSFRETHQQENFFFDGVKGELSSQRVVLRCRFYNHDKRAIVTLKVLPNGTITVGDPFTNQSFGRQPGPHPGHLL